MNELIVDVGETVLESFLYTFLNDVYTEYDFSSNKRSRKLSFKIDTDVRNLSYEINLKFKSEPRWDGVIR
ncbi:MAG: hypothetical protein IKR19_08145 [Acholeplasmatales bacterium]|nr:hypothetical protein [Acholeplasmatales bacterium]